MIAQRWIIRGTVQGVGFRDWMVASARALGISGWVRNRRDGAVDALVAGDASALGALEDSCRDGPPLAEVDDIEVFDADPPAEPGFHKRPTA